LICGALVFNNISKWYQSQNPDFLIDLYKIKTMDISQIQNIILTHLQEYNPVKIGIFGSFARGDNDKSSDIDVLIEFKDSPSLLTLIKLENELSDLLGIKVDLVTAGAIKNKRIKKSIKKDLIYLL